MSLLGNIVKDIEGVVGVRPPAAAPGVIPINNSVFQPLQQIQPKAQLPQVPTSGSLQVVPGNGSVSQAAGYEAFDPSGGPQQFQEAQGGLQNGQHLQLGPIAYHPAVGLHAPVLNQDAVKADLKAHGYQGF